MDGPLVPEVAAPAVVDLSDDRDVQPAKKRRVRERLPKHNPIGCVYSNFFNAGRDLFKTEYANEARLRVLYPIHYALDGKYASGAEWCTKDIQSKLWSSLSPNEIREWNNKVEPDHETKQLQRLQEKKDRSDHHDRNENIMRVMDEKRSGGCNTGYVFNCNLTREQIIAHFTGAYDKAAALVDAGASFAGGKSHAFFALDGAKRAVAEANR